MKDLKCNSCGRIGFNTPNELNKHINKFHNAKIKVELTEDQAYYIDQLLEKDIDLGDDSIGAKPDKAYNAFIQRIRTKLAKAKS